MGAGRDQSGKWHPYEDFRWSPEFAAFLAAVDRQGGSAVDLILNGDTFELLQSTDGNCAGAAAGLGCTEGESLARLERVLRAHEADVKALGQFARRGSNRVVFVPGGWYGGSSGGGGGGSSDGGFSGGGGSSGGGGASGSW